MEGPNEGNERLGGSADQSVVVDQSDVDLVGSSLGRLESYILGERLRGYDPYDALASPLFRLPLLRSSRWIRIAAEQALKRSPYNIRPLLRIPKGYNPVTVAFVLEASAYRALAESERADIHRARATECVAELSRLQTAGYSGACWGYDFDWESRYGRLPAGTPTIVATGLVTNSLFVAYRLLGLEDAFGLCESAASFVLEDLPRLPGDDDTFCWAYYPRDTQYVLNATLKGARLCAQVYAVTQDERALDAARRTVAYVQRQQREDGSWPYAATDRRSWADNFHTAYVLDALDSYAQLTGDTHVQPTVDKGWNFYRSAFFLEDRIPTYYPRRRFPIDATACAQSLLTLCRFKDVQTACSVAKWTIGNMQCSDGHFAYQRRRRQLVKIPYMRWSSAYMYLGLSRLAYALGWGGSIR